MNGHQLPITRISEQLSCMDDWPAMALISKNPADDDTVQIRTRLKTFSRNPNHQILTHRQGNMMHDAGIRVFPFNVDPTEDYEKMLNMEVDCVSSSDSLLARKWKIL